MKTSNIVYLHAHDAGRAIEPYGAAVPTPALASFAREAVLFRNAHAACPTCSPSRSALLTGTYPHENGMFGLSHRTSGGFSLNNYNEHLVSLLQRQGYECVLSGIQHVDGPELDGWDDPVQARVRHGARIGYDRILNVNDMNGPFGSPMAAERAAEFLGDSHDAPFFLSVGLSDPHAPFDHSPNGYPSLDERYAGVPATMPDTSDVRKDSAVFASRVMQMDQQMGFVLDAIERHGLTEETLVICTTDHGIAFPGMKCTLRDLGTGVFLMMRGPGGFGGGRLIDAAVSQLDIMPTIWEHIGLHAPERFRGASLIPLVNEAVDSIHEELFSECTYHGAYQPMRAVRTDRWKYIKHFYRYPHTVYPNQDYSRSKKLLYDLDSPPRIVAIEELYDLALDPLETCNLAADPSLHDGKESLKTSLREWMGQTNDPLLTGPIPIPAGSRITPMHRFNVGEELMNSDEWNAQLDEEWICDWT